MSYPMFSALTGFVLATMAPRYWRPLYGFAALAWANSLFLMWTIAQALGRVDAREGGWVGGWLGVGVGVGGWVGGGDAVGKWAAGELQSFNCADNFKTCPEFLTTVSTDVLCKLFKRSLRNLDGHI